MKEKARNWEANPRSKTHPSWVERQVGLYDVSRLTPTGTGGAVPPPPQPIPGVPGEPGTGRKAEAKRKRAEAKQLAARQRVQPTPAGLNMQNVNGLASAPGHPKRKPDGTYLTGHCGTQLCFEYSRNANGCTATGPCKQTQRRLHQCELCLGLHRTILCTVEGNQGWQPPPRKPPGGGKGGGRGAGK